MACGAAERPGKAGREEAEQLRSANAKRGPGEAAKRQLAAKRRWRRLGLLQHYAPNVRVQAYLIAPETKAACLVESAIAWNAWIC